MSSLARYRILVAIGVTLGLALGLAFTVNVWLGLALAGVAVLADAYRRRRS